MPQTGPQSSSNSAAPTSSTFMQGQTITVEPWPDFDRIEEVIVLESQDKELQKIMETAGEPWLAKPFNDEQGG